jgi:AGCS family alanine or glycine:cation symporter
MAKIKYFFFLFFISTFVIGHSQLKVDLKKYNNVTEKKLKNGEANAIVSGGQEPYSYYWSNQSTSLDSSWSRGLTEGVEYKLVVTDAAGLKDSVNFEIEPAFSGESINKFFKPIVDAIGSFLMYDPFAALGIYDNKIYDDAGNLVTHPNGDAKTKTIPFIVIWLVLGAIFFTIKMKFINFRGAKHAVELVRGVYDDPNDKGEVSHFQALTTALSGTVGLGNIAGVAMAVSVGGAGATFWMITAGLIGMASKFVECTLGVKYREIDSEGNVSGGPMYYLKKGLEKRNLATLGKVLAVFFAVLCIGGSFGGGNMFQANQAFEQLSSAIPWLHGKGVYFGIVMALLVGVVIIGGVKSIAKVTDKIVPFMVGIYVLFALIIIGMNITSIGDAFGSIVSGAFSPGAIKGGVIGVLIIGFQRAAFSNEAGVGSASIAHSAAKTDEPVSEGIVALLEPFIDTVVVCTMTALVLIFTGYADDSQGLQGAGLTSAAFGQSFEWFKHVLTVAIVLFAFSTMISWSYYGLKAVTFLFGNSKWVDYSYKLVFMLFVVIGAASGLDAVIDFSDFMVLGMAFPNILGLLIMSGEVKADMIDYFARIKSGAIKRFK